MTIKFIRHKLLKAGYYCERNPRTRVVRVWSTSKGMHLPALSTSHSLLDYACFFSYSAAYRDIIINHITF